MAWCQAGLYYHLLRVPSAFSMLGTRRILGIAGASAAMTPFAMVGCITIFQDKDNPLLLMNREGAIALTLSSLSPSLYAYFRTPTIFYNCGGAHVFANPNKLALNVTLRLVPQCVAVCCATVFTSLFYKHALRWPLQNFERRRETHSFGQPLVQKIGEEVYWPRYETFRDGLLGHIGFVGMLAITAVAAAAVSAPVTVPCGWIWLRGAFFLIP